MDYCASAASMLAEEILQIVEAQLKKCGRNVPMLTMWIVKVKKFR